MYRHSQHEFHKVWLRLTDDDPNQVQGYLKVSAFINGPNEQPPVHGGDESDDEVAEQDEQLERAGLDPEAILEAQRARNGLATISAPLLQMKPYQLFINIYKGEGFPLMLEETAPSAYISVRTQASDLVTRVIPKNSNPNFLQKLYFPIYMPTYNDKITMHLYHSEEGRLATSKVFLANIPERPGPDDYMNISQLIALDGNMKPNWVNLYGIHPHDRGGSHGNKIKLSHSSSFMGRILMSLHLQQNDRP